VNDEQIRITALTEMFLGLGHEPTPERIAYYTRLLVNVPIKYIRVACDQAVVASSTGYPPSPGEIIRQAERIHREIVTRERRERADAELAAEVAKLTTEESPDEVGRLIDMALNKQRGTR
jgi:hypothetical protein